VKLIGTWRRQAARAAGASLIAPLALLLAAAVVASGGGLGGIGSLSQVASGPALPDIGLESAPAVALEDGEIVEPEVAEPGVPPPAAPSTGPPASAAPTSSAPPASGGTLLPGRIGPRPRDGETFQPPATLGGEDGATVPSAPAAPEPVDDLLEVTRGVGNSMPGPLGPLTNDVLNLLLGPPRP